VSLPQDAKVENAAGEELTGETQQQENQVQGGGGRGTRGGGGGRGVGQGQQAGREGGAPPQKQWWLEYELATGTVVLSDKYEPAKPNPTWRRSRPTNRRFSSRAATISS